ncbi:hypothetical protein AMATHDRAFT_86537 [Amanita thiersii Skay4041]|uniref:Prolyl 4-hydroxylase alpha subunit Fe(2+) 2OG dioxygenase domain-containing protein n=1 Tax=Amanita thiersii Skay4041 TaxID=703135 RepID=A0A2A9NNM2_9AGAR|nr:hypothetical protein AMATHDRAFT_86537 [Amanita thiersii Skay4041]
MDRANFSLTLDLERTGLKNAIRERLLGGILGKRPIRAELYKLNVYGEGSFFKAHKDTPRGGRMFGSLVIVYSTPHQGGSLLIRKGGQEWVFDLTQAISGRDSPQIGYIALYSDVEHEVALVTAGYRVTVTYNLYIDDSPVLPAYHGQIPSVTKVQSELKGLLEDPEFLKEGANIGFGLSFRYPVESCIGGHMKLRHLDNCLKGIDGEIMQTMKGLSLKPKLWMLMNVDYEKLICPEVPYYDPEDFSDSEVSSLSDTLQAEFGAKTISDSNIHWVTNPQPEYADEDAFAAYGNEAQLIHVYRNLVMIVPIGPPGARSTEFIDK